MKVLIATQPEYMSFLSQVVEKERRPEHSFVFTTRKPTSDFQDYNVGISFMWTSKIQKFELKVPWFNFHPAPLPGYKGRNLCYHAIMNKEKEFGATIHYMDEGFDTGDIIEVWRFPMLEQMVAEDVSNKAIEKSKALFRHYLPKILETPVFPRVPNVGGTYYKKGQIIEEIPVKPDEPFGQFVRAVTYKDFHPRIDIGGVKYKIVREE
jgi:methionyl-tRNA formyltransferase